MTGFEQIGFMLVGAGIVAAAIGISFAHFSARRIDMMAAGDAPATEATAKQPEAKAERPAAPAKSVRNPNLAAPAVHASKSAATAKREPTVTDQIIEARKALERELSDWQHMDLSESAVNIVSATGEIPASKLKDLETKLKLARPLSGVKDDLFVVVGIDKDGNLVEKHRSTKKLSLLELSDETVEWNAPLASDLRTIMQARRMSPYRKMRKG